MDMVQLPLGCRAHTKSQFILDPKILGYSFGPPPKDEKLS